MQSEKAKALGNRSSNYSKPVRWLVIPGTAEVYKKEEMEKKKERKKPLELRFSCLRILKFLCLHLG